MHKKLLVLKVGTSSITKNNGSLDEPIMVDMARQLCELHQQYRIVLVSSGAVGSGKIYMKNYTGKLHERKAAAAIGNPLLLHKYAQFLAPYGIHIAQSLCERHHFSNRQQFLQLKETFETLWENDIIPIANENDVVSNLELKFSDNDELASLIAIGFGADQLLLATSVPGVLNQQGEVVNTIDYFDEKVLSLAKKDKSTLGLGGMISKLTFARLATQMGVPVTIFGLRTKDGILKAVAGETGTLCKAQKANINARKRWLASGSVVQGGVLIDAGAEKALRAGKSLLSVGVQQINGTFEKGEVIEILSQEGRLAVARSKCSSEEVKSQLKQQNCKIAHADDIVIL